MKYKHLKYVVAGVFLFSLSVYSEKPNSIQLKMRQFKQTLEEMLAYVASDARFSAKENTAKIEKTADELGALAADLFSHSEKYNLDPGQKILAGVFQNEAKHGAKSLKWGHREYARNLYLSMPGYCISCHTRNSKGPSFSGMELGSLPKGLTEFEKASYLAAVRNYDDALNVYEKIISNPDPRKPFEFEKAVYHSLSILVRVKSDPEMTMKLLEKAKAAKQVPYYLREYLETWKKSVAAWTAEQPRKALTDEGLYAEAVRLTSEARKTQAFPADHSGDILYLRAGRLISDLLGTSVHGKRLAESLYLAGLGHEALSDSELWTLHDFYYLACIDSLPHSEIARQCFRSYEESVYHGYTGSSGTHIPDGLKLKLKQLDLLSDPKAMP